MKRKIYKLARSLFESFFNVEIVIIHKDNKQLRKIVCKAFDFRMKDIRKQTRKREIVQDRQVFQAVIKYNSKLSNEYIGKITGGLDRTSVNNSVQKVKYRLQTERRFNEWFYRIIHENKLNYPIYEIQQKQY